MAPGVMDSSLAGALLGPAQLFEDFCAYLSDVAGFEVDKLRYLVLWGLSVPLAFVMHYALPPSKVGAAVRHCYATSLGILMGVLCFGWGVCTLFAAGLVGYLLLLVVPPRLVHKVSMAYIIGVIGAAHVYRMLTDYGGYHLDFTGPLMILVQKISLAACALHDGRGRKQEDLNEDQAQNQLQSVPAVLDYFSYCFNFLQFLAGPTCTFREYQMFIDGTNFSNGKEAVKRRRPNTFLPWLLPFLQSIFWLGLFLVMSPLFSADRFADPQNTVLQSLVFWYLWTLSQKSQYYFAWKQGEGVCNAAGLGFSGYDEDGAAQWDLAVNIRPLEFEFAVNPRMSCQSWNVATSKWLRRVCFERVTWQPTLVTFTFCALWHGFYLKYYMVAVMVTLVVEAARKGRRTLRPHFTGSRHLKLLYDIMTITATSFYFNAVTSPILAAKLEHQLACHSQFYFVHDIILVVFLLLPVKAARPKKEELGKGKEKTESRTAGGSAEGDRHTLKEEWSKQEVKAAGSNHCGTSGGDQPKVKQE